MAREVNRFVDTHKAINGKLLGNILKTFEEFGGIFNILQKEEGEIDRGILENVVDLIIELRLKFRERKEWQSSGMIRSKLREIGIIIEDTEKGTSERE